MEVVLQFWPVFLGFIAFLVWLIRLEARSVENTMEIKRLWNQRREDIDAAKAARKEGVPSVWGGDWKTFKDGPHFELDRRVYSETDWSSSEQPPQERQSAAQSRTVQASAVQIASGAGGAVAAVGALDGVAQIVAIAGCFVVVALAVWIMRERLKAWADGWR